MTRTYRRFLLTVGTSVAALTALGALIALVRWLVQ